MHARFFSFAIATVTLLALQPAPARAIDWIADRDIGSYCQQFLTRANSPSGAVCLSYIQGYLDGLRTTEKPAFGLPYEDGSAATAEQAAAVSAERMNALVAEFGPPARAGICLPEDLSRDEIVRVIARALRYGQSSGRSALDDYAQVALQERYPCDTSDPVKADEQRQPRPEPLDLPEDAERVKHNPAAEEMPEHGDQAG